jgi:hypothetical protein
MAWGLWEGPLHSERNSGKLGARRGELIFGQLAYWQLICPRTAPCVRSAPQADCFSTAARYLVRTLCSRAFEVALEIGRPRSRRNGNEINALLVLRAKLI